MQYSEKYPFDYSPRGGTIDELGASYVDEIKRIYDIINELRENKEGTQEPQPHQLMVSDQGKVYIRAKNNMSWVYIGEVKENFGLNELGFVKKEDIGLNSGTEIPVVDKRTGLIQGSITGSAMSVGGFPILATNIQDGEILVYRPSYGGFVNETKAAGVGAQEISFVVNGVSLASYSGIATTNIGMLAVGDNEPDGADYSKPPVWIDTNA